MMTFILCLIMFIGFSLLSASLRRHYNAMQLEGRRRSISQQMIWLFRSIGYSMLIIAVFLSINEWGITLGLVYWCANGMLVAFLLSMILTYYPQLLRGKVTKK